MFKIYDDKVYFVAETPNINKVIEIFLPKDDRILWKDPWRMTPFGTTSTTF